jgi:hypothetical protein
VAAALVCTAAGCAQRPVTTGAPTTTTDDLSALLQPRLDRRGARVFLPKLPGGRCYRTHGLWISHSDTSVSSDGACLVVVGPGPVRLHSADGDPIAASAAFFISRSSATARPPEAITIRGLRIIVEPGSDDGIDVYGSRVRILGVRVEGSPFDDVYIGGRTNLISYSRNVVLADSHLSGAERNVVSVTAAVDVRITHNVIAGAGLGTGGVADPGDGIDVEPNAPSDPILGLVIARNLIVDNVGTGIALALHPQGRPANRADRIAIVANRIVGNSSWRRLGGITVSGGQADHHAAASIVDNVFAANGGPAIARDRPIALRLMLRGNRGEPGLRAAGGG